LALVVVLVPVEDKKFEVLCRKFDPPSVAPLLAPPLPRPLLPRPLLPDPLPPDMLDPELPRPCAVAGNVQTKRPSIAQPPSIQFVRVFRMAFSWSKSRKLTNLSHPRSAGNTLIHDTLFPIGKMIDFAWVDCQDSAGCQRRLRIETRKIGKRLVD
jgi:hypothetical protein